MLVTDVGNKICWRIGDVGDIFLVTVILFFLDENATSITLMFNDLNCDSS